MNSLTELVHRGCAVVAYTPTTRRVFAKHWQKIRMSVSRHVHITAEVEACEPYSVRRALRKYQPDLLIAAGGDGTVNLCIQAMQDDDLLAILPLGTANDMHRSLRRTSALSHRVDRIRVNDQAFCTTGGIGIPSTIAQRVNRLRQGRFGRLSRNVGSHIYLLAAADLLLWGNTQVQWVEIEWQDVDSGTTKQLQLQTNTLFVTNQATFGGSLRVVNEAVNNDGHFEICIFKNRSRWQDLLIMGRITAAADQHEQDCHVLRTPSARIITTRPMPFFGDGEIIANNRHFELEIAPGALKILDLDWALDSAKKHGKGQAAAIARTSASNS